MHNATLSLLVPATLSFIIFSTIILQWTATSSLVSFYKALREKYPEIRNNLGVVKGTRLFVSQVSTIDNFVNRVIKTYSDTFRIYRSFGSRIEIESFYQDVVDIKALRLTGDVALISKWESFLLRAGLFIKGLVVSLVLLFSSATVYYIYEGLNYLNLL